MPQTGANRAAASMTIGFESVKETQFLSSNLIVSILIVLFSITGCSDAPHVGSMLTVDDVDRYITSTEASVCLENTCIAVIPEFTDRTDGIEGPIIHIHPDNFSYIIYRRSASALPAETVRHPTRDGGDGGGGNGGGGFGGGRDGDGGDDGVPVTTSQDDAPPQDGGGGGTPLGGGTLGGNTDGNGSGGNGSDTCPSGYVVWVNDERSVGGFLSSGVICEDYLHIDRENSMLTFTGSDGVVDGGENETTEEYVTVETGYTYEEASDRAPKILREY